VSARAAGAASELLVQSLTETAAAMRRSEQRCRSAYTAPGPLRDASERLADTYARAAVVFEEELEAVGRQLADEAVGVTASGAVVPTPDLAGMNRGRAAVGMPPLVLEDLPPRLRCPGGMALCPACGGAKPRVGPNRCWEGWHDLPAHTAHDFEQVAGGHCGVCGYGHK
jgi:hypothetical protein